MSIPPSSDPAPTVRSGPVAAAGGGEIAAKADDMADPPSASLDLEGAPARLVSGSTRTESVGSVSLRPASNLWNRSYRVPKSFSTGALLGFLLLCAATFSLLKFLDQSATWYLFFGTTAVIVALCQMQQWAEPRLSSSVAGAVLLPIWLMAAVMFSTSRLPWQAMLTGVVCGGPVTVIGGALFGYIIGAILASVFMIGDYIDTLVVQRFFSTTIGDSTPLSGEQASVPPG